MLQQNAGLRSYAARERKRVQGWLARVDAEIIMTMLLAQVEAELGGAVAEIGIHHGKCLIELCLGLRPEERAYGIDIFDAQHMNQDRSGKGDRRMLEANLTRFGVAADRVVIDSRSSQEVKPSDIMDAVGPVRLFSVDGGHWLEIVRSDLRLAEAVLAPHGVIALDDFLRTEWPDVSAGYFGWFATRERPLVPFAIGFNKLYLCEDRWVSTYAAALQRNVFLRRFLTKRAVMQGCEVPIYQSFIVPDWSRRRKGKALVPLLMPELWGRFARPRG
ncbi:class I SAM-dependent methyltransferase [Sphingomonas lenta]|uniref:Class I SAM-dependent methyltransferase n=1 Tax=Sphingomonas lenta TaxID=1141887 RepID=A0A2A2SK16_9SPHN|nr:class I SAM-dependent methyltransferase [Sphingomonas lenta]PAX09565.1 hypothetical protein CKY28_02130 [Sphingomonas lenta]